MYFWATVQQASIIVIPSLQCKERTLITLIVFFFPVRILNEEAAANFTCDALFGAPGGATMATGFDGRLLSDAMDPMPHC